MTAALAEAPFPYDIRRAEPADSRFIIETTAKVRQPRDLSWSEWGPRAEDYAEHELVHGQAWIVAAGVVLGFLLTDGQAVSMLYVKRDFRGLGFGIGLLVAAGLLDHPPDVKCYSPTPSFRAWCKRRQLTMLAVPRPR